MYFYRKKINFSAKKVNKQKFLFTCDDKNKFLYFFNWHRTSKVKIRFSEKRIFGILKIKRYPITDSLILFKKKNLRIRKNWNLIKFLRNLFWFNLIITGVLAFQYGWK